MSATLTDALANLSALIVQERRELAKLEEDAAAKRHDIEIHEADWRSTCQFLTLRASQAGDEVERSRLSSEASRLGLGVSG